MNSDSQLTKEAGLNDRGVDLLRVVSEIHTLLLGHHSKPLISIKCVGDVLHYCRAKIAFEPVEMLLILFLDNAHHIMSEDIFYKGTVDSVSIYPRDIFRQALNRNAASLILVHNHPGGNSSPSAQDVILTQDMIKASEILNIAILDHIIVCPHEHTSLREMGFISYDGWGEVLTEK